jgi:hypothetical protein
VDRHGVSRELLDFVADLRQVVALRPVERLDPLPILVEERVVEGRAGGEGEGIADLRFSLPVMETWRMTGFSWTSKIRTRPSMLSSLITRTLRKKPRA